MKRLTAVLTVVILVATMAVLTGCSKSESENEPTPEPIPQHKVTKENIVGVWRSGDYWVSFSEDGYCGAYLSDKCVAEGNYDITDDDVILVDNTVFNLEGNPILKFTIDKCENAKLSTHIAYIDLGYGFILSEGDFQFVKSSDRPVARTNELIGHSMETDKYIATFTTCARMDTNVEDMIGYYVYLPPYLYYAEMVLTFHEFRRNETIIIKKVSVADNGDIILNDVTIP